MRRPRKVFAAHGGELAHKLLAALEAGRPVERFVDSYVVKFGRLGLRANPERYRELRATLGREALLAMVTQVNAELPRYLTRRRPPLLRGAEVQAADAVRAELLGSLARALAWTPSDAEEFRRDLELYAQLGARTPLPKKSRKPDSPAEGPFVDRCALLLDPSMLDTGRRAAGQFLVELERATEETLARVFRRG
jgi:hypothetical protein